LTRKAREELEYRLHRPPRTLSLSSPLGSEGDELVPETPSPSFPPPPEQSSFEHSQPAAVAQNQELFGSPLPDDSESEYTENSRSGDSPGGLFVGDRSSPFDGDVGGAPRVNYMARWRTFSGKEALPGMETSKENSKKTESRHTFEWVRKQVDTLKPVKYKVTRLDASVYFQGQSKGNRWTQTLREYDRGAYTKFLTLLLEKKKERDAKRGAVKEIWVDFDLFVQPDEHL
jgi:hypothetical protein